MFWKVNNEVCILNNTIFVENSDMTDKEKRLDVNASSVCNKVFIYI